MRERGLLRNTLSARDCWMIVNSTDNSCLHELSLPSYLEKFRVCGSICEKDRTTMSYREMYPQINK